MKTIYFAFILVIAASCTKEQKCWGSSEIKVSVKNAKDGSLLSGFTYKVESYGIAMCNHEVDRTGEVENGSTAFCYKIEGAVRVHEISVQSTTMKGHFVDHKSSDYITSDQQSFVFYFEPE